MLRVKDVMSTNLITLSPADSLKTAREIMSKSRIRHVPILSAHDTFVGLLTQRDILRASVSLFADVQPDVRDQIEDAIPLSEAMTTEVMTIPPDLPLAEAAKLMLTHKFGCLPVLERERLRGILTEADFVKLSLTFLEAM